MTTKTAPAKRSTRAAKLANPAVTPEVAAAIAPTLEALAAAPAAPAVEPVPAEQAAGESAPTAEQLKAAYTQVTAGEIEAKGLLKRAKLAAANMRVIRSRIVYAAGMLKPLEDGKHNLAHATRLLALEEEDLKLPAKELAALTKRKKNSLLKYGRAGAALAAAGHGYTTAEPTDEEREIVAESWKLKADGTPEGTGNGTGTGEGEGEGTGEGTPTPDAMTAADLMAHVSRLEATLKALKAAKVPVSLGEGAQIAAMVRTFVEHLEEYATA